MLELTQHHRPEELPSPSRNESRHSQLLVALIRDEIETAGGSIDFSRFMELALYAPGLGYYSAGQQKFGEAGDFITAPELTPIFGRCLARQCRQVLAALNGADILEFGAGSGTLAAELLSELARGDSLPKRYYILELSADLRQRQAATLKEQAPAYYDRVHWLEALPEAGFRGVMLGNEVLDAMPVERFSIADRLPRVLRVAWRNETFAWHHAPADDELRDFLQPLELPEGYTSEINFQAKAWTRSMAERLAAGVVLLIDYGFPRTEFYHPQRVGGSLMCHYRHRAHSDPLILVGLQDVTAHVDFTAIAEAAVEGGLSVYGYTSQALFLIGCGLEEVIHHATTEDIHKQISLVQNVNKLTSPAEMGELYKVIALGRGMETPLIGFQNLDRRGSL